MKNLRFKTGIAALIAVFAIGATTAAYADRHGRGKGNHGEMGMLHGKLAEKLNLTAEQKTKLQEMWKAFKESNKATHEQIQQNRKQLHELTSTENYSRTQAEQLIKHNSELQAKMKIAMLNQMEEMKKVLTPEQQQKFKELRAERGFKMAKRKGNHEMKDNRNQHNSHEKAKD